MKTINLNDFLTAYFTAHHCEITHKENGILTIQLTEEIDRALMNRPFYWHYVKSSGGTGDPSELTLITNPDKRDEQGEWIHFGSPRLQQIMNHLKESNKHIRSFQKLDTVNNTALYPWLLINLKITYQGNQQKNELFSIGLNLVNGRMQLEMMETLKNLSLSMSISDYCYSISPLIKLDSGYKRIETIIDDYVNNQEHLWAAESMETLTKEIEMIEYFYEDAAEDDQKENEIKEINKHYTPHIYHEVITGGIVYLVEK